MSFQDGWWQTSFTRLREKKWLGCHLCEGETSALVIYCPGVMFSFVSLFVIRAKLSVLSPFVRSPRSNRTVYTPPRLFLIKELGLLDLANSSTLIQSRPLMLRPHSWRYVWWDPPRPPRSLVSASHLLNQMVWANQTEQFLFFTLWTSADMHNIYPLNVLRTVWPFVPVATQKDSIGWLCKV